jgi:bifunctional oligoribonuclease and PAP phosphatase NrnA
MKLSLSDLENLDHEEEKFLQFFKKKISEYSTVIIHRHVHPDGDAYGSQFGLKYIIEKNWPNKKVLVAGRRETLKAMKEKDFGNLEYFNHSDKIEEKDYRNALVIVVDTANSERIDGEFWNKGKEIIKIDHHYNKGKDYSIDSCRWIDEKSSSCSQMIAWWAISRNLSITDKARQSLYLGMITDTNRFLYIKNNQEINNSLLIAAKLIHSARFSLKNFYQSIYTNYSEEEIRIKGFILSNFKIKNNLAYIFIRPEDFLEQSWKLKRDQLMGFVNCLSEIEGIEIWALFVSDGITDGGEIRVSLRSGDEKYSVNKIAQIYGGGGHDCAAGINLSKDDWKKAQKIIEQLITININVL